jgi:hypothetical protein
MTTADLISANTPTQDRPAWAHKGEPGWLAVRVAAGDVQKAALDIDTDAARLGIVVTEVARVLRDGVEIVFARGTVAPATAATLEKSKTLDTFLSKAITETKTEMAEPKNPKLRGLISSIAKFHHDIDVDTDNAVKLVEDAQAKRTEVFSKLREHVGSKVADISGVVDQLTELDGVIGANGAPLGGDSKELATGSANSQGGEVPFVAPKSDAA